MGIDGIGGDAPSLDLLCNALGVGRGKDAELGGGAERWWEIVEEGRYSVG